MRRAGGELKAKPARRRPRPHGQRPRPHGQWPARRSGLVQKAPHDPLKQFPALSGRNAHAVKRCPSTIPGRRPCHLPGDRPVAVTSASRGTCPGSQVPRLVPGEEPEPAGEAGRKGVSIVTSGLRRCPHRAPPSLCLSRGGGGGRIEFLEERGKEKPWHFSGKRSCRAPHSPSSGPGWTPAAPTWKLRLSALPGASRPQRSAGSVSVLSACKHGRGSEPQRPAEAP